MKDSLAKDGYESGLNPLDGYERFLKSRKARFQRLDSDSLAVEIDGYGFELYWNEEDEALSCSCAMDYEMAPGVRDLAAPVIMHINRRQWLGHFEISEDGFPCFRYTMLFHGAVSAADNDVIEEMVEIASRSCDQHAPAFALMAQAKTPDEFPRLFDTDGRCAPLGLALLDAGGQS
ncbi:MAG: YbjN domain-containing protein [Alphaproteobacteria bacterium]|nr:YbjN domain-containing protein [Alphaproteobacteria bacterium]USO07465.1 MAG: YbjN domain-containing protein [Rhodospirillales bacterium]